MNLRRLTMLIAVLCAVVLALPALAQDIVGPVAPSSAPTPPAFIPPAPAPAGDGTNPLRMLEAAGATLGGGRGAASPAGDNPEDRGGLSTAVNILVVLTVVSLAPSIVLMTTCFMRILIVLGLLKQAMGTQSIPPPQVVTALALFMTLFVMGPTLNRINDEAITPYRAGEIRDYDELWTKVKQPMRDFMFAQIEATGNWSSLYMVLDHQGIDTSEPENLTRADVSMTALIPAFMLSEMKVAFLMGFKVYLPFLVIDLVISTMLISMSMMMLPPVLISLPFKLLLFVLVDGWTLIVGSLMSSFAPAAAGHASALHPSIDPIIRQLLPVFT